MSPGPRRGFLCHAAHPINGFPVRRAAAPPFSGLCRDVEYISEGIVHPVHAGGACSLNISRSSPSCTYADASLFEIVDKLGCAQQLGPPPPAPCSSAAARATFCDFQMHGRLGYQFCEMAAAEALSAKDVSLFCWSSVILLSSPCGLRHPGRVLSLNAGANGSARRGRGSATAPARLGRPGRAPFSCV